MTGKTDVKDRPGRRRVVYGLVVLAALVAVSVVMRVVGSAAEFPRTGVVRGTVTYKGQPLNGGQIRFTSRDPANKVGQASAMIDRDGHYEFGGVPVGPVTVTVNTSVRPPEDYFWRPGSKGPKPIYVPARYADPKQSGVALDLGEGIEDHDIHLD